MKRRARRLICLWWGHRWLYTYVRRDPWNWRDCSRCGEHDVLGPGPTFKEASWKLMEGQDWFPPDVIYFTLQTKKPEEFGEEG